MFSPDGTLISVSAAPHCGASNGERLKDVFTAQFSPLANWVLGVSEGRFSRDILPVFSAGSHCEQFVHRQECPFFNVVHLASFFSADRGVAHPPTRFFFFFFEEAVVTRAMTEPCKFPSLDSCQKKFLWTHKEVDLALHTVIGLVLQVRDTEKFPQAHGLECKSQEAESISHSHGAGWS